MSSRLVRQQLHSLIAAPAKATQTSKQVAKQLKKERTKQAKLAQEAKLNEPSKVKKRVLKYFKRTAVCGEESTELMNKVLALQRKK